MSYDVKLDANLDISIPSSFVKGEQLIIQKCKMRLEAYRGEWILDSRYGQPWLEWVDRGVSEANLNQISDVLRLSLEEIDGVRKAVVTTSATPEGEVSISIVITLDASQNRVVLTTSTAQDGTVRVRQALGGGVF